MTVTGNSQESVIMDDCNNHDLMIMNMKRRMSTMEVANMIDINQPQTLPVHTLTTSKILQPTNLNLSNPFPNMNP